MKRLNISEKIINVIFILSIVSDLVNEKLLDKMFPEYSTSYFFWFSLGLYFGFKLYKRELFRFWKSRKI